MTERKKARKMKVYLGKAVQTAQSGENEQAQFFENVF